MRVDGTRAAKGARVHAGAEVRVAAAPARDEDKRPLPRAGAAARRAATPTTRSSPSTSRPGYATHPLRAGERGTIANALVARYPECALVADDPREGGVAHRLDSETSGIVLAARTTAAWQSLRRVVRRRRRRQGVPRARRRRAAADGHDRRDRWCTPARRVRVAGDRDLDRLPARTDFETLATRRRRRAGARALVARPHAPDPRPPRRTLGHPLVGDALYGGPPPAPGTRGHFLHAAAITFPHPSTGARTRLEAPLPADRAAALVAMVGWPHPRV